MLFGILWVIVMVVFLVLLCELEDRHDTSDGCWDTEKYFMFENFHKNDEGKNGDT